MKIQDRENHENIVRANLVGRFFTGPYHSHAYDETCTLGMILHYIYLYTSNDIYETCTVGDGTVQCNGVHVLDFYYDSHLGIPVFVRPDERAQGNALVKRGIDFNHKPNSFMNGVMDKQASFLMALSKCATLKDSLKSKMKLEAQTMVYVSEYFRSKAEVKEQETNPKRQQQPKDFKKMPEQLAATVDLVKESQGKSEESVDIPDGHYAALWSGYTIEVFVDEDGSLSNPIKMDSGVRGINCRAEVIVRHGLLYVIK